MTVLWVSVMPAKESRRRVGEGGGDALSGAQGKRRSQITIPGQPPQRPLGRHHEARGGRRSCPHSQAAAARSAVPLACATCLLTTRQCRLPPNTCTIIKPSQFLV